MPASAPKSPRANGNRPGRPPRALGSVDNRHKILDLAEALFAERGFHGVSVRDVTRLAEVDVALVYYYFASKRDLFDAVLLRRATIVNNERLVLLERAERMDAGGSIEALVAAFIDPLFDYLATGESGWRHYFALIAQVNNTTGWGGEVMTRFFDPVVHRMMAAMQRLLPEAGPEDLYWAYQFLSGALTLTLAHTGRVERLSGGLCRSEDYGTVRRLMPRFVAAGFRQLYADRLVSRDKVFSP